jgi:choline dehydrogenase-like flavoprotein
MADSHHVTHLDGNAHYGAPIKMMFVYLLVITRMSNNPFNGMVDKDCRVHWTFILSMAGSSVFPTYGTANPTLTIVALDIRLSNRIKANLG